MNNWEKSNLELTPAPELTMLDESGMLSVLIKHDYYSSDNDNGRRLLGAFLDNLAQGDNPVAKIFIIDSGVKLLNDDAFSFRLEKLFSLSRNSYICEESISSYGVEYEAHDNVTLCSAYDISMEVISSGRLITLE